MKNQSRILIALSAVLMMSAYFLPLWKILLGAPQYPEGLEMKIWLTGITGNVDQINGLNHYIGMKHIIVANFWEFKVLPYVYGLVVAFGFFVAWKGKLKFLWIWMGLLVVFAIFGFTDFYLWEYDYGHHLDPHAAIKIEGMTYQPPLIGYKQLLNFLAGSLPDIAAYLVGLGGIISVGVLFFETHTKRKFGAAILKKMFFLGLMISFIASGCSDTEPQPLSYGKDICEHCKMVISDQKYGAEMITKKGKVYKFDSAECLIDFIAKEANQQQSKDAKLLAINFAKPGIFMDAKTAFYLKDKGYHSPMGGNIAPFETEMLADNNQVSPDAKVLTFEEVVKDRKQIK